jgi:hypothetical protein
MCALAIDIVSEARNAFQKLRTSRTPNHAILLRPEQDELKVLLEQEFPEGKSLDELASLLPPAEPRFIVIMPERVHPDGRKSYPIVLVAYCPAGLAPQVNVVYSNARTALVRDFQLNLVWEVKKKLQLGDEELSDKFATNKW